MWTNRIRAAKQVDQWALDLGLHLLPKDGLLNRVSLVTERIITLQARNKLTNCITDAKQVDE